ncbi:MAG TPA: hypothetical protein VHE30_08065 [Polyangiaceae bacterium]|nr:hypothetical protein [Polyangiaceae bacterium]
MPRPSALFAASFATLATVAAVACSSGDDAKPTTAELKYPTGECGNAARECPDGPKPVFTDVFPIIQAKCNDCHVGGAGKPWQLDTYENVAHWATQVRADLQRCTMPPADAGNQLTTEERKLLITWVVCGTAGPVDAGTD